MKFLISLFGWIKFPFFKRKSFGSRAYRNFIEMVRPGDLVFTKSDGFFLNILNPSKPYKHVGIVTVVHDSDVFIVEAVGKGVVKTHAFDFFKDKSHMGIYRIGDYGNLYRVIRSAVDKIGSAYDHSFASGNKKYYCFELAALAFRPIPSIIIKKRKVLWREQFLAQSFIDSAQFNPVLKAEV